MSSSEDERDIPPEYDRNVTILVIGGVKVLPLCWLCCSCNTLGW